MLTKKEAMIIVMVALVLGFAISLMESINLFLYASLSILLIILINFVAKKVTSYYYDSNIEIKLWEIKRYGYRAGYYFKNPIPAGVIIPLITTALSLGYITWLAPITFDVKAKIYRAAKRHNLYKYSEMTEYHLAHIAAAGIVANLFFGIIGYLINQPQFAQLNLYYAFYNIIPFSDLDGSKIFFGSLVLWSFLATIVLIGLMFAIFAI